MLPAASLSMTRVVLSEETALSVSSIISSSVSAVDSTHYQFNGKQLALAKEKINHLIELTGDLYASDMHELMFIYELKERLTVCLSVIAHLGARKETRWHSFAENLDYPDKSDDWMKYVNSRYENGQLHMIYRELVGREARYEHND